MSLSNIELDSVPPFNSWRHAKIFAFTEIQTLHDLAMFVKKLIRLARKSATASHIYIK